MSANETAVSLELGSTLSISEQVYSWEGNLTFQWYVSTASVPTPTAIPGATNQVFSIAAVSASNAGTYSLTATDLTGPTNVTVAIVTIDPPAAPIFVTPPQAASTLEGQSATFTVATTGSLPQTFQWYDGAQPIAGATGTTFTINAARLSDAGSYSVVATNATGSTQSSAAELTVTRATAPTITSQPNPLQQVSYGQYVNLSVGVSGSSPMFYQWYQNGLAIPGANYSLYSIQSAVSANAGTYTVTAVNAAGSASSADAVVTVSGPVPVSILEQPAPLTTTQATSTGFALYVFATGSGPMTYQWYKNNNPIAGAVSSDFSIPIVKMSDAGSYTVVITNPVGSAQSNAAVLVVNPPGPPSLTGYDSEGRMLRAFVGQPLSLTAPETTAQIALTSQWYLNGQAIPGANSSSYGLESFGYANVGEYVYKASTVGGSITVPPVDVTAQITAYPSSSSSWMDAQSLGSVAYFLFSAPAEVLRYDMSALQWLAPFTLPATPTAMRVAAEGVYVAFGDTGTLYPTDFSTPGVALPATTYPTTVIFLDSAHAYLYGINPNYQSGTFTALSRSNLAVTATYQTTYPYESEYQQISVSAAAEKGFGYESEIEASSLIAFDLGSDGSISGFESFSSTGSPAYTNRTFVSPDGSTLVAFDGTVYNTTSLAYVGMLAAGDLDDICFLADGDILALRGNQFSLYDSTTFDLLGRLNASFGALKVFEQGTTIFAFAPTGNSASPVGVSTVAESAIAAAVLTPAPALTTGQAQAVATAPDDSLVDNNGLVYLLDRIDQNILIWSPGQRTYLSPIPLSDCPDFMTYSGTLNRIYVDYPDGRITQINLSTSQAEQPFATISTPLISFTATDSQLYAHVSDDYDSGDHRELFSTDGQLESSTGGPYLSTYGYWDSATQSLYEPYAGELLELPVDAGSFGTSQTTPYNGNSVFTAPLRFSLDGSLLVTANGLVYSTAALASQASFAGSFVDEAWLGANVFGLSSSTSGSEVQLWSGPGYTLAATTPFAGTPLRIWPISGTETLALSAGASGPIFTVLGANGSIVTQDSNAGVQAVSPVFTSFSPPNLEPTQGSNVTFSATADGPGITYQWEYNYSDISGATSSTLTLNNVQPSAGGEYLLVATNAYGQTSSESCYLQVQPPPGQFSVVSYNGDATALSGETATFNVVTTGTALSYQWYFLGTAVPGATGPTLVLNDVQPASEGSYSLVIWYEQGGLAQSYTIQFYLTVVLNGSANVQANFTGNGNSDIIWQNSSTDEVGIWLMNGSTFTNWVSFGDVPSGWEVAGTGSFDSTGNTDILWQNTITGERGIWLMNGTSFSSWVSFGVVSLQWQIVGTGSFDNTGNTDILWQNTATGEVGLWMMNGTTFSSWISFGDVGAVGWQVMGTGSFDNTGNTDILWQNTATGEVGLWMMNGATFSSWISFGDVGAGGWQVAGTGSFGGSGGTDILWQNTVTSERGIWMMNGASFSSWVSLGDTPLQWQIANH
jgi:hypothetical protein